MVSIFKNDNTLIIDKIKVCNTFLSRAIGLMFHKHTIAYNGVLLYPCFAIHTYFMLFNIDCYFLTEDNIVLDIFYNVKPMKFIFVKKAKKVLEVKSQLINPCLINIKDKLIIK